MDKITFQDDCHAQSRKERIKCRGIQVQITDDDNLELRAINSRDEVSPCFMELPLSELKKFIALLKEVGAK